MIIVDIGIVSRPYRSPGGDRSLRLCDEADYILAAGMMFAVCAVATIVFDGHSETAVQTPS